MLSFQDASIIFTTQGQLVVQKARALVLLTDTANQHSITSLQNCVSYLCTLTPDVMLMCDAPWDGRVSRELLYLKPMVVTEQFAQFYFFLFFLFICFTVFS